MNWAPWVSSALVYMRSSHRRKSAACPKFDMVWLHRSPIPVGRRGVISSFKWFLPAIATRRGRGGEVRHSVGMVPSAKKESWTRGGCGTSGSWRWRPGWTRSRTPGSRTRWSRPPPASMRSLDGRQITWFESDTAPAGRRTLNSSVVDPDPEHW